MKKQLFSLLMLGSLAVSASIFCAERATTATQPKKIDCFHIMEKLIAVRKFVFQQQRPLTIEQYETIIANLKSVIPVLEANQENRLIQIILRDYPLEASKQLLAETTVLLAELLKPTQEARPEPTSADAAAPTGSAQPTARSAKVDAAPAGSAQPATPSAKVDAATPTESAQPATPSAKEATKGLASVLSTTGYVATRPVVWTARALGTVVDYTTPAGDVARTVFHPARTLRNVRESSAATRTKKVVAVATKTALTAAAIAMFAKDWFANSK